MTSEPTSPPTVPPLHSPKSPVWPTFPFHREGSRVWERGGVSSRDLPSPLPTKRTRTYSATARASAGPVFKGVCKQFSRSQGHGFITPENGSEDIFVHVSDIEGEYVPVEGDEVTYKMCPIPPKNQKFQAVEHPGEAGEELRAEGGFGVWVLPATVLLSLAMALRIQGCVPSPGHIEPQICGGVGAHLSQLGWSRLCPDPQTPLMLCPGPDKTAAEDLVIQTHVPSGRARHGHPQNGPQPETTSHAGPCWTLFLKLQ
uniref:Cold-shock domain-containing protein n=1 Tax=Canis lupus familiaris TaxID=9615 RepID=A0A8C0PD04_CANLF